MGGKWTDFLVRKWVKVWRVWRVKKKLTKNPEVLSSKHLNRTVKDLSRK